MDVAAVRQILDNAALQSAFQAFLLMAREDGNTVREIAGLIGVHPATIYRWLAKAKRKPPKGPHVETVQRAVALGDYPCDHDRAFYLGRKRICLDCMAINFHLDTRRRSGDPVPDDVFKPAKATPTRRERRKAQAQAKAQVTA